MACANPRINLARAHGISKHRVGVGRGFRNRLQHVPVLQDSAIRIEPENVHAGVLFAAPIQIAHMNEGQIAFNGHTLDLTGNTARLPEVAFQWCCPVWKERIVLDVCTGDQVGQQVGFALVEHFPVEGIERSSNLFLVWSVKNGLFHNLRHFMVVLVVVCVVAVIVYCWPSLPRTESNRDHSIPDGIERGQEGKRQYRANGCAADQHIRH